MRCGYVAQGGGTAAKKKQHQKNTEEYVSTEYMYMIWGRQYFQRKGPSEDKIQRPG